jgi:hypothetical protein
MGKPKGDNSMMEKAGSGKYLGLAGQLSRTWLELDCPNPSRAVLRRSRVSMVLEDTCDGSLHTLGVEVKGIPSQLPLVKGEAGEQGTYMRTEIETRLRDHLKVERLMVTENP